MTLRNRVNSGSKYWPQLIYSLKRTRSAMVDGTHAALMEALYMFPCNG